MKTSFLVKKALSLNLNNSFLIFDLDGTLVDTNKANFLAYKYAIKKVLNIEIKFDKNNRFTRQKLNKFKITDDEFQQIVRLKNKIYHYYLKTTSLKFENLKIVKKFNKNNILILATNGSRKRANLLLKYYNLKSLFNSIFFKEDYVEKENKFQYVCEYLNLDLNKVYIFENDELEIEKAISIGINKKRIFKLI